MPQLAISLERFLRVNDLNALRQVLAGKAEVDFIDGELHALDLLEITVRYHRAKRESFKIAGEQDVVFALRQLEILRREFGMQQTKVPHEIEHLMLSYLLGDNRAIELLRAKKNELKEVEADVVGDELIVKLHLGFMKTKGILIKGEQEVIRALERIHALPSAIGKHAKRPRIKPPASERILQIIRMTWR